MKSHKPPAPIVLHPKAQVLITGKPITPEQAARVLALTNKSSLQNWCSPDGTIGHIDAIQPGSNYNRLYGDLLELSQLLFLDIGVSVMSGPPKTFTTPVVSFSIKDGMLRKEQSGAHFGHPPPRRLHKDVQSSHVKM